jgi:hypothetical protein
MKGLSVVLFFLSIHISHAQNGFPFGRVSSSDCTLTKYAQDTSASALVLDEFGEAYIENGNDNNLIFVYHTKIKILKRDGIKHGVIEIPLYSSEGRNENVTQITASAFNLEGGGVKETKLESKNIFSEKLNDRWTLQKFAIPGVKIGTVIEFSYQIESPFIYKFRKWKFQSDIPKVRSEYWTTIPANYLYNITLRGFLKLTTNKSELVKSCFHDMADCTRSKYTMEKIPAFVEEDYMTAASNFISAINYELSEIKYFNGRVERFTEEWRDAELKLQRHEDFGDQIKKAKNSIADRVQLIVLGELDSLSKAKKIYDSIKSWYRWNENNGILTEAGIKKAYETKIGNVADINLTLLAALRIAGLNAAPVILSTRENGLPIELHPVISDFNYVLTRLRVGSKNYLLDATDPFQPFGMIPFQCFNGKGRVLEDKTSYWIPLLPQEKAKKVSTLNLKLEKDGYMRGTLSHTYYGYGAMSKRKEIASFNNQLDYLQNLQNQKHNVQLTKSEIQNFDDFSKHLIEKFDVEIKTFDNMDVSNFLFNPFLENRVSTNPFKSSERLYPVDYGIPKDESLTLSLELPEDFEMTEIPNKAALSLPNAGGRYLFSIQISENKIVMNNILNINRTIYTPDEYQYLKELYNRIIQIQSVDLVFQRKQ